jgi:hypothetical protein
MVDVGVALGFIRAGKDPRRTPWDKVLSLTIVLPFLIVVFRKEPVAAVFGILASELAARLWTASTRPLRLFERLVLPRLPRLAVRDRTQASVATMLGYSLLFVLCVFTFMNPTRAVRAQVEDDIQEGTPRSSTLAFSGGAAPEVRRLDVSGGYLTRVTSTGGTIRVYQVFWKNGDCEGAAGAKDSLKRSGAFTANDLRIVVQPAHDVCVELSSPSREKVVVDWVQVDP